jgi:excisionase family DNA binding protein
MTETLTRPMNVTEAAEFLGLSTNYIYKMISRGKIPCYKPLGKRVFFKAEELEAFIFRGKRSADFELSDAADQLVNRGR